LSQPIVPNMTILKAIEDVKADGSDRPLVVVSEMMREAGNGDLNQGRDRRLYA
jgi:hypothetical protein